MATVELTKDNFETVAQGNPLLVVDFWAEWCPPCRKFGPVFDAASERHPDVVFGKVNTDEQQELALAYNIRSIPTVMVVRDGAIVHQQPGMLNARQLDDLLNTARSVDIDEMKAEARGEH